ncbi:AAA family ATPase [Nitrosospira sp. Is2]|uniref:AAA family ATPase n=1 Tax=Nitrosospira sp. Is2 TaxID=3080532 RepID=UPI002953F34A|nr:AAA family ATPase [Nitrosospira sp. Is2]WON73550.1 AAA family ATPase [Nitrosospira sp. Is2]
MKMIDPRAVREVLIESKFHNITEIRSGVVRGEWLYDDRRYAIAYVDFTDDVVRTAENLRTIQEQLLGADYFNNSDQLRWNSYLYILAGPKSLKATAFQEAKACIEANRDYARKYVLSIADMRELLTGAPIAAGLQPIDTVDAVGAWAKILEAGQLNMLLDKPTRTRALELIEKGQASKQVAQQKRHELKLEDKSLTSGFLRRLHIKTFRPIHNGRTFDFADINLIVGPNGSGKTSLLEAIEYLYCNNNRRDQAPGPYKLEGLVEFAAAGSPQTITTPADTSSVKARNFNWYRREGHFEKGIVAGFTRYNFLDTDAAFRISTELDPSTLNEDIRRLLIGPDASTFSDYLEKVKEDLGTRLRELNREARLDAERCDALKNELKRLKQAPTQATSLAKTFRARLREVAWKGKDMDTAEMVQSTERSSIEKISRSLVRIRTLIKVSAISKAKLRSYISVLRARQNLAIQLELERGRLAELLAQQKRDLMLYKHKADLLSEWYIYCVADAPILIRQVETHYNEVRVLRKRLGALVSTPVPQLCGHYNRLDLDTAARQSASEVLHAQKEVKTAESAQRSIRSLQESLQIAQKQLQDAARQLITQSEQQNICPVCKTLHHPGELNARIEALVSAETPPHVAELASRLQDAKTRQAQADRREAEVRGLLDICSQLGLNTMATTAEHVASTLKVEQQALKKSVESLRLAQQAVEGLKFAGLYIDRYEELRTEVLTQYEYPEAIENLTIVEQAKKDVKATVTELEKQVAEAGKASDEASEKLLLLLRGDELENSFAQIVNSEAVLKLLEEELSRAMCPKPYGGNRGVH